MVGKEADVWYDDSEGMQLVIVMECDGLIMMTMTRTK